MPRWFLGGLVVALKAILHVLGPMSWSTGLPRTNIIPSWAHLGPVLALCWGILGPNWAQVGPSWAHLGPCWGHLGALLEGPGRHPEADSGLGGTVFEPTCGKEATCQKPQKTIEKSMFFDDFCRHGASRERAKLFRSWQRAQDATRQGVSSQRTSPFNKAEAVP